MIAIGAGVVLLLILVAVIWSFRGGDSGDTEPISDTLDVDQIPGFQPQEVGATRTTETTDTAGAEPTDGTDAPQDPTGATASSAPDPGVSDGSNVTAAPDTTTTGETNASAGSDRTTAPSATGSDAPTLSDGDLQIEFVGSYVGSFLEDGTGDMVTDVAALLVTNCSERMVQVAQITFQVNATEQANFQISDVPAGATVLALELNRRPYSADDDYSYGRTATAYMDTPSLEEDKFALDTSTAGTLTLKNLTDATYAKVYVYYKYFQADVYMGGITYRVPFENVPAKGEVESVAGHFDPEVSRIMAVVIMPEETE